MDPAQLANEALRRFAALHTGSNGSGSTGTLIEARERREAGELREPGNEPLLELFTQLGQLDGWAKIAMDRLVADPQDARAEQELCRCLEHTARLHPHFTRRLADVLADRPAVKTSISSSLPQQSYTGTRAPSEQRG
jgi:hypothetical protein